MSSPSWQISGDYFETCSCDFLCPCITSNMAAQSTEGHCNFAILLRLIGSKLISSRG